MEVTLRKVEGGYELFIPEDVASRTGLTAGELELLDFGEQLLVRCPGHRNRVLGEMYARITPETLHDPNEPYDSSADFTRAAG